MLIASGSQSGHFMRKSISWSRHEKKYIFRTRNSIGAQREKYLLGPLCGEKLTAIRNEFDGKSITIVSPPRRTGGNE
jgi:hypothetical protein